MTLKTSPSQAGLTVDDHAVLAVRNLVLDMCMQNGGGHGGSALGMAAIGVALWKYTMRYNPLNPNWFDRDRFVLSNGHASMFLYIMNHLVGYEQWTMEQLKGYGDAKENGFETISHAHPEIAVSGIEISTGPLGQGIANAVGLAIASKHLAANFNQPGIDIVQSKVFCMTGDGCLMEGVALEAISLAGHLQLDNLILLYDDNQITCDGPLHWINSEDINTKMQASGWLVLEVADGSHDVQAIVAALSEAKLTRDKPIFVHVRTVIGVDTLFAGTSMAHHGSFDVESIARSKQLAGLSEYCTHRGPDKALEFSRERIHHGKQLEKKWNDSLTNLRNIYPDVAEAFTLRLRGDLGDWKHILAELDNSQFTNLATRETNGLILAQLWDLCPSLFAGGADLVMSNKIPYKETDVFHPANAYKGRFIRYGIREHAMAAISNGLAAYNPGTFLPLTATFFMFSLYAAPAVRMGALSNLQVIHVATHDSFAEGQNGPTHQPVELDSLYRAMPNLVYIRSCDSEELIGAWDYTLSHCRTPIVLSLARDPVSPVASTSRSKVSLGAYVLHEHVDARITLVSCGSNLHYVKAAAESLATQNVRCRLVSAPSLCLFEKQTQAYKDSVFPEDSRPIVSVEEFVATTWTRYVTASIRMTGFGYSASNKSNYRRFGLDKIGIVEKVLAYLASIEGGNARVQGWRQL